MFAVCMSSMSMREKAWVASTTRHRGMWQGCWFLHSCRMLRANLTEPYTTVRRNGEQNERSRERERVGEREQTNTIIIYALNWRDFFPLSFSLSLLSSSAATTAVNGVPEYEDTETSRERKRDCCVCFKLNTFHTLHSFSCESLYRALKVKVR